MTEPTITINDRVLTADQARTVHVALGHMLLDLDDKNFCELMGPIADAYRKRANEILEMMRQ